MSAHEAVAVDDLRSGDRIKIGSRMRKIVRIEEYPATRLFTLEAHEGSWPWQTFKRRRTLVYREVREGR